jgi:hypothetical protein
MAAMCPVGSLALLELLAVASTSLGKAIAFGAAATSRDADCAKTMTLLIGVV